jgi:hypothetical protein
MARGCRRPRVGASDPYLDGATIVGSAATHRTSRPEADAGAARSGSGSDSDAGSGSGSGSCR